MAHQTHHRLHDVDAMLLLTSQSEVVFFLNAQGRAERSRALPCAVP